MKNLMRLQLAQVKLVEAAMALVEEQCGTREERPEKQTTHLIEVCKELYSATYELSRSNVP